MTMRFTHYITYHTIQKLSAVQRFVRFAESTIGAQLEGYYVGLEQHPLGCQVYIGMCIKIKTFI